VFASSEYREVPTAPQERVTAYDQAQAAIAAKEKAIKAIKDQPSAQAKRAALRAELATLKKQAPPKYAVIHTLADAARPTDMPVLTRGNPATPGTKVARRFLTALGGDRSVFHQGSGRLELARAIADAGNPLTARVMVNRVWQHHFGRGLVGTDSNFGALGERPTHPELLDWLARRFIESGWSLKAMHREILLSSTYRQSSRFDSQGTAKDPANTLLWRMNRRRLDVEAWRDAMLAVAGRLDTTVGGPSVSLDAPDNRRRTVYAAISRHDLAGMLRLFDFPDPNITSGRRVETTVPLQQLFVLNSEFMAGAARDVADRLGLDARSTPSAGSASADANRIRRAYLMLYGRAPVDREIDIGLAYLHAPEPSPANGPRPKASTAPGRWERYAQALLAANEFFFVD